MRVTVLAVGRMKPGPEKTLVDDYLDRFDKTGRQLGLGPVHLREVEARKGGGQAEEGRALLAALPEASVVIALDERGKTLTSRDFSKMLERHRDDGMREVVFLIGGADGLTPEVKARADTHVSFGKMVWPHMLARVMLAEQLFRAASISGNAPYHRD